MTKKFSQRKSFHGFPTKNKLKLQKYDFIYHVIGENDGKLNTNFAEHR